MKRLKNGTPPTMWLGPNISWSLAELTPCLKLKIGGPWHGRWNRLFAHWIRGRWDRSLSAE
jgi:hypothetical protein